MRRDDSKTSETPIGRPHLATYPPFQFFLHLWNHKRAANKNVSKKRGPCKNIGCHLLCSMAKSKSKGRSTTAFFLRQRGMQPLRHSGKWFFLCPFFLFLLMPNPFVLMVGPRCPAWCRWIRVRAFPSKAVCNAHNDDGACAFEISLVRPWHASAFSGQPAECDIVCKRTCTSVTLKKKTCADRLTVYTQSPAEASHG